MTIAETINEFDSFNRSKTKRFYSSMNDSLRQYKFFINDSRKIPTMPLLCVISYCRNPKSVVFLWNFAFIQPLAGEHSVYFNVSMNHKKDFEVI